MRGMLEKKSYTEYSARNVSTTPQSLFLCSVYHLNTRDCVDNMVNDVSKTSKTHSEIERKRNQAEKEVRLLLQRHADTIAVISHRMLSSFNRGICWNVFRG